MPFIPVLSFPIAGENQACIASIKVFALNTMYTNKNRKFPFSFQRSDNFSMMDVGQDYE